MGLWNKKPEGNNDQSKSEVDALVEALTAKFEEKLTERLTPLSTTVTSLSEKWQKIETDAQAELDAAKRKNDDENLTEDQKRERREQAQFALSVQTNARITENDVVLAVQSEYPQIVADARKAFQETGWQRKALPDYPQYCQNIIDMLVGREARKSGLRYNRDTSKFMIEDAAAKTGGPKSPLNDPNLDWVDPHSGKTLSPGEQLAKLGIDPEKFAERMKNGVV